MAEDKNAGWGTYLTTGFETAVGVGMGYFVGQWLDKRYGTGPWATLIGAMLGLAAGMYLLLKSAIKANRD